MEWTDEALMLRYADGDGRAFDELFRRYEPRAYAFFLRRTGSPERARDLYQELFLRIHRARARYDAARSFAPWLFQIAHRLLIDDQRRAFRSHEVSMEACEAAGEGAGPEDRIEAGESLGQALAALSRDERYVLIRSKLEGVSYPALAAELGKSVVAIRKMASRALQRMRVSPLPLATATPERG